MRAETASAISVTESCKLVRLRCRASKTALKFLARNDAVVEGQDLVAYKLVILMPLAGDENHRRQGA